MPHAVAVFVEAPEGIPLVKDPNKPLPHFWKLPGGKGEDDETPEESGVREMEEETGVIVPLELADAIYEEPRRGHDFHLIHAKVPFLKGFKGRGVEGEIVRLFDLEEIKSLSDLMPSHRRILKEMGFLNP